MSREPQNAYKCSLNRITLTVSAIIPKDPDQRKINPMHPVQKPKRIRKDKTRRKKKSKKIAFASSMFVRVSKFHSEGPFRSQPEKPVLAAQGVLETLRGTYYVVCFVTASPSDLLDWNLSAEWAEMRVSSVTKDWPQKALVDVSQDWNTEDWLSTTYLVYLDTYLSNLAKLRARCSSLMVTASW